jgi:hypothetical protein
MTEPLEGVLEPWSRKVEIRIGGTSHLVPENQDVIRIFQYLGLVGTLGFFAGHYCWNATCNNCIFTFRDPATGKPVTQRACQTRIFDGLEVLALPKDVRPS